MYYFIGHDGSHGCSDRKPENVVFIDKPTYDLISENRDILDITVEGTVVKVTPNFGKYKDAVARKLEAYLHEGKHDFNLLNELHVSVEYATEPELIFNGSVMTIEDARTYLRESVLHWQERCKTHRRLSFKLSKAQDFSDLDNVVAEIGG